MDNRRRIEKFCKYHNLQIVSLQYVKWTPKVPITNYWSLTYMESDSSYTIGASSMPNLTKNVSLMLQKIKDNLTNN